MTEKKTISAAQLYERITVRTAIAILLLAANHCLELVAYFSEAGLAKVLDKSGVVFAALVIVLILPSAVQLKRYKRIHAGSCREPEGFILEAFKKASLISFGASFISLSLFKPLALLNFNEMPADFMLNLALSILLGSMGIAFFYYSKDDSEEDDFAGEETP